MVQRDGNSPANAWVRETQQATADKPRRDVVIRAVDDGVEIRTWTIKNAWISRIAYHVFDAASAEMVEEILTIHYDGIEEKWPATS